MATKRETGNEELKKTLRTAGFKATPARLALLSLMKRTRKPLSAQRMIDALKPGFDQATVYRIVKNLISSGIIRQVDLRHNHGHYELADAKTHHHHVICRSCGRIEDAEACLSEKFKKEVLAHSKSFSTIDDHALEFFGVCNNCTI
jgi:Fe2+ or Zn2+ uptake regulation protein